VEDFAVQRNNDMGLPRISGRTSSSSAPNRPGCLSISGLSPPPGARRRVAHLGRRPRNHAALDLVHVRQHPEESRERLRPDLHTVTMVDP
jgi:hypothetical protein